MLHLLVENMEYAIYGFNVKEWVISYKGGHIKHTLSETKLCDHGCYIHRRGRHPMDLVLEYLSLLLVVCDAPNSAPGVKLGCLSFLSFFLFFLFLFTINLFIYIMLNI